MLRKILCVVSMVACSGTMALSAEDLKIGDKAPDFSATGIDGKPTKLSSRFGEKGKNVVLLFSRASW